MLSKVVHNQPITLKVAKPGDFTGVYRAFAVLLILAAILSPHPVIMLVPACCLLAFCPYIARKLAFTHQRRTSALVLYPAGNISLIENGLSSSHGKLRNQHWLIQPLSVLAVVIGSKTHRLVLLANQQNKNDYRRLLVCMQHKFTVRDE